MRLTRHHVHERVLQRMAHVERAGDVWWWDSYAENRRVRILINLRGKIAILLPALVMMLLRLFGIVLFGDVHVFYRLENEKLESTIRGAESSKHELNKVPQNVL